MWRDMKHWLYNFANMTKGKIQSMVDTCGTIWFPSKKVKKTFMQISFIKEILNKYLVINFDKNKLFHLFRRKSYGATNIYDWLVLSFGLICEVCKTRIFMSRLTFYIFEFWDRDWIFWDSFTKCMLELPECNFRLLWKLPRSRTNVQF